MYILREDEMEFQVIYSRKIQGAVMLFTAFMFACQYGLTRETVTENFSRTGICWSELDRKSTRLNSSHRSLSRMPSSA